MKVFKLFPSNRAKFHFGDSAGKLKENFSSDQLFSALFNCAVLFCGAEEATNMLIDSTFFNIAILGTRFVNRNSGVSKNCFYHVP